jgi:hypothetical protein
MNNENETEVEAIFQTENGGWYGGEEALAEFVLNSMLPPEVQRRRTEIKMEREKENIL